MDDGLTGGIVCVDFLPEGNIALYGRKAREVAATRSCDCCLRIEGGSRQGEKGSGRSNEQECQELKGGRMFAAGIRLCE